MAMKAPTNEERSSECGRPKLWFFPRGAIIANLFFVCFSSFLASSLRVQTDGTQQQPND
jgi:hypothetical protein